MTEKSNALALAQLLMLCHDTIEQLRAERNTAQANLASTQIAWENWRVTHSTASKDMEIQLLREVNAELLGTLKEIGEFASEQWVSEAARAAIAKVEEVKP
jgi:hypothetical protein